MSGFLVYLLFGLGFVFLVKGADYLIDGASSIAKRFQISNLVIGLTIVALGTSMPELMVNIVASISGRPAIAIGNVIGSNIANICLVLGLAALIFPLTVKKNTVRKEIPYSLFSAVLLGLLANNFFINSSEKLLSRIDGLIFLLFFVFFMIYTFSIAKEKEEDIERKPVAMSMKRSILLILSGSIGLAIGGSWVVNGAVLIARNFGISESLIALTVIAVGTTLPEIVTSVVAALRKNPDIAVGNVVGSNIFNFFFVLGISSIIRPIQFNPINNIDIAVTIAMHVILLLFMFIGKRNVLTKWKGFSFLAVYATYLVYITGRR